MNNDMPKKKKSDANAMIMHALNIDSDDLLANQDGFLGSSQKRRLLNRCLLWLPTGPLSLIFLVLANILNPGSEIIPYLFMGAFTFGLISLVSAPFTLANIMDLRANQVKYIEGRVWQEITSNETFKIRIDKTTFQVRKTVFLGFRNGEPYGVYYTSNSRTILGAQWLNDDPFTADADEQWQNNTPNEVEEPLQTYEEDNLEYRNYQD